MRSRTTWREKLEKSGGLPKVVELDAAGAKKWGGRTLAVPCPLDVDALMRAVPFGRVTTTAGLRAAVAAMNSAEIGCPLTTGMFAVIAAHAAEEASTTGQMDVTPWWRTLKTGGELNPKYPGGAEEQKRRLEAEGHTVVAKGKSLFVQGAEEKLADVKGATVTMKLNDVYSKEGVTLDPGLAALQATALSSEENWRRLK